MGALGAWCVQDPLVQSPFTVQAQFAGCGAFPHPLEASGPPAQSIGESNDPSATRSWIWIPLFPQLYFEFVKRECWLKPPEPEFVVQKPAPVHRGVSDGVLPRCNMVQAPLPESSTLSPSTSVA